MSWASGPRRCWQPVLAPSSDDTGGGHRGGNFDRRGKRCASVNQAVVAPSAGSAPLLELVADRGPGSWPRSLLGDLSVLQRRSECVTGRGSADGGGRTS